MSKKKSNLPKVKAVKPAPVVKAEKPSLEARMGVLEAKVLHISETLKSQFGAE